jgi:putative ABC transport system substrate-binding protein
VGDTRMVNAGFHRLSRLSRREFVAGAGATGLGLLAGCGRLPFQGPVQGPQSGTPPRRIGLLTPNESTDSARYVEAFRQSLRTLGRVDGQDVILEARYSNGATDRLPDLAAELVGLQVDVVLAQGTTAVLAVKEASTTMPIVFVEVGDPVGTGLVASLARPGGQATGLAGFGPDLAGKRLELLKETVPAISRLAVFRSPNPANAIEWTDTQHAAQVLGLGLQLFEMPNWTGLNEALTALANDPLDGLLVLTSSGFRSYQAQIIEFAIRSRLPTMAWSREFPAAGGFMAYGPNLQKMWSGAATYVDRILKGAKPADLPVEQPMTFEFVVNMKTAQALGAAFPPEIQLQITEVIQ